jgi:hypothetical protein
MAKPTKERGVEWRWNFFRAMWIDRLFPWKLTAEDIPETLSR